MCVKFHEYFGSAEEALHGDVQNNSASLPPSAGRWRPAHVFLPEMTSPGSGFGNKKNLLRPILKSKMALVVLSLGVLSTHG